MMGNHVWDRECNSPSDGKIFNISTQQLQFNPTKSSRLGFRRSIAAIADLARSRGATVSSRASHQRHKARGRADHVVVYRESIFSPHNPAKNATDKVNTSKYFYLKKRYLWISLIFRIIYATCNSFNVI